MPPRRVLMLHGAGGGGWEWQRWRAVFEAHDWWVDTPDLQPVVGGIGATTLDDYIEQVRDWVIRRQPAVIIGASLGGLLCLAVGEMQSLTARVLVNPLPPRPEAAALGVGRVFPDIVRWRSAGRYAGTRDAMAGSASSASLFAFRRWRDESGQVLNAAHAGIPVPTLDGPCLVLVSDQDQDVPADAGARLALRLRASLLRLPGAHLDPLLGDQAHSAAEHAVGWLNTVAGFRSN